MLLTVTTSPINPIPTLDSMSFSGSTGLQIRQNAVGGSNYILFFVNEGAGTLYWANGTVATITEGIPVGPGQSASISIEEAKDLSFVSDSSSTIRIAYVQEGTQISSSSSSTQEVPAKSVRSNFLIDVYIKGFIVNLSTNVLPVENPADNTLFFDDDTLPGAKGMIFEKKDFESDSPIALHDWIITAPFVVGANAFMGVSGTSGERVFIRTHQADGVTPITTALTSHNLAITLQSGASAPGVPAIFTMAISAAPSGSARALSGYLAGKTIASQGGTPTEAVFKYETYQANEAEVYELSHIVKNTDPELLAGTQYVHVDDCGFIINFTGAQTSMNTGGLFPPCDTGVAYTFSNAVSGGHIAPIGADTTATYGYTTIGDVIYSYN